MAGDKLYATSYRRGLYTFQYTGPTKFEYYKVSGRVVDQAGQPVEGVAIGGLSRQSVTNKNGDYEGFVQAGQHTIVPTKKSANPDALIYTFTPNQRIVTVPPEATQQNFTVTTTVPWQARGLSAVDNTLYVADGKNGLRIMDISQPGTPLLMRLYDTAGEALAVHVANGYAYIIDSSKGVQIINVSTPQTPTLVTTYQPNLQNYKPSSITVDDNYVFVVGNPEGKGHLHVIDVTNPANPVEAGHLSTGFEPIAKVDVIGKYVYLLQGGFMEGQQLRIVDISNPSNPTQVGKPYPLNNSEIGTGQDLKIIGNYAYVLAEKGFQIVDISNPEQMNLVGQQAVPNGSHRLFVQKPYAYIVNANDGLTVMDISNPAQPVVERGYNTAGQALDVWARDNYVYIADYKNGLLTLPFQSIPLFKSVSAEGNITPEAGGTAQTKDGMVKLDFPPQAANTALTVTITLSNTSPQATPQFAVIGNFFEITAVDVNGSSVTQFNQPFTLTVSYHDESWQNTTVSNETKMQVYFWDKVGGQWQSLLPCDGCSHDTETNSFTMTLNHLTQFAILSEQQSVYLPIMSKN